jgi:hypothetical protein
MESTTEGLLRGGSRIKDTVSAGTGMEDFSGIIRSLLDQRKAVLPGTMYGGQRYLSEKTQKDSVTEKIQNLSEEPMAQRRF